MSLPPKIWFITGVSRGLGKTLAQAVLAYGDCVIGTTRDGRADFSSAHFHCIPLDMTIAGQARAAVDKAYGFYNRFDVVVNNAGYGLVGAVEEASAPEAQRVFDVNFFGPLQIMQAALPVLRKQRSGHIINISSIAGLAPMAGSGVYAAAKAALAGVSQSLAEELAPLGVRVTTVVPGGFRTDFLSSHSLHNTATSITDYKDTAGAVTQHLEKINGKQLGDPERAAQAIITLARAEKPPMHLLLGSDALRRARALQAKLTSELKLWEEVSLSTDFVDADKSATTDGGGRG